MSHSLYFVISKSPFEVFVINFLFKSMDLLFQGSFFLKSIVGFSSQFLLQIFDNTLSIS